MVRQCTERIKKDLSFINLFLSHFGFVHAWHQILFVLLCRKLIHVLRLSLSIMYRTPCTVPLSPSLGHTLSRLHSAQLLLHMGHLTSFLLPLVGRLQLARFSFINSDNAKRFSSIKLIQKSFIKVSTKSSKWTYSHENIEILVSLHANSLQTSLAFGKQTACKLNYSTLLHPKETDRKEV